MKRENAGLAGHLHEVSHTIEGQLKKLADTMKGVTQGPVSITLRVNRGFNSDTFTHELADEADIQLLRQLLDGAMRRKMAATEARLAELL